MKEEAGQVLLLSDQSSGKLRGRCAVDLQPAQAEVAFTVICDPISATDWDGCLGTDWRFRHVLTDGLWKRGREGGHSGIQRQ